MIFLKLLGGLLVIAGILLPLGQLQAMVHAGHAAFGAPDAGSVLHNATPGILAWNVPANVLSPILLVLGVALMAWERKPKRARFQAASAPAASAPAPAAPASRTPPAVAPAHPASAPFIPMRPAAPPPPEERTLMIRPATADDWGGVWPIFRSVVGRGETYAYEPATSREEGLRQWMVPPAAPYVALAGGEVVGTYSLKPQSGAGAHVANATFLVPPSAGAHGVGGALGAHALAEAKRLGYAAIQVHCVSRPDAPDARQWEALGFSVVGTVPQAFRHQALGLTDVLIMHRFL